MGSALNCGISRMARVAVEAVHLRHHRVHQDESRRRDSPGGARARPCRSRRGGRRIAARLEDALDREDVAAVVVDDEDLPPAKSASDGQRRNVRSPDVVSRPRRRDRARRPRRSVTGRCSVNVLPSSGRAHRRRSTPPSRRAISRLIVRPEPGAAVLAARRAVGLLEGLEDELLLVERDADARCPARRSTIDPRRVRARGRDRHASRRRWP